MSNARFGARFWPLLAAIGSTGGALLHVAIVASRSPEWYGYFEAPPAVVQSVRDGTWAAPISGLVIAGLMQLAGLFAFSAAGLIPRLPLLKTALTFLAVIGLLRGLAILPLYLHLPGAMPSLRTFDWVASLIWGVIGIGFAVAAWQTFIADLRSSAR